MELENAGMLVLMISRGLLEFQEALYVGWKLFLDGRGKFGGIYVGRMGFR